MESDDNVSGEFQRSTRMPLDAVVRLHFQGTVAYQNGFAANVSATGMFVKHPAPPPLGTQLVFEFNLGADRKPVQGAGEVVWVREKYLGPGQPAGVGIRFLQLDSQSRDHIAEALFEYLEQSLADDSLLDASGYPFGDDAPLGASEADVANVADVANAGNFASAASQASNAPGIGGDDVAAASAPAPAGTAYDSPPRPGGLDGGYGDADRAPAASPETYPQPFDFAALERLPERAPLSGRAAPLPDPGAPGRTERLEPASADGRRAFSVFSPLDEADAQTADIVREALREEAPLPSMAAAAAASSARSGSQRWIVALVLALIAVGGYFAWQQWGPRLLSANTGAPEDTVAPGEEPPAPALRKPEPLTAAPEPGTTLAEAVGVDPDALSPATAPPLSIASEAPADEAPAPLDSDSERPASAASNLASDAAAALAADSASAAPPENRPATPPAAAAEPPRPPAATVEAASAPAERLTGIAWRQSAGAAGETVLVLAGDGAFRTGSFSYSEIGGENPRVLVKLKGMANPYRGATPRAPEGGGTLVRGVRTGFHVTATGNEIHVVVDLAQPGIKVVSLTPADSGLSLVLAR